MKIVDRCDALVRAFVTVAGGALLMSAIAGPAFAQKPPPPPKPVLQFKGGIGVIPLVSVTGCAATPPACVANLNVVRGVPPGGQIWVINNLDASVNADGSIKVNGKGLIEGSSDIAGRAPGISVIATLICEPSPTFIQHSTSSAGVLLSPTGDFQINDTLAPLPPAACTSPMLLIRRASSGNWLAVGILSPPPPPPPPKNP